MSSRGKRTSLSGLLRQHPAPYQARQAEGDETNRRFAFSLVDDYGAAAAAAGAAGAAGAASPALTMASTTLEQKRSAAAARTARERQAEQKHYMRSRRAGVDAQFRDAAARAGKMHVYSVQEVQDKAAQDYRTAAMSAMSGGPGVPLEPPPPRLHQAAAAADPPAAALPLPPASQMSVDMRLASAESKRRTPTRSKSPSPRHARFVSSPAMFPDTGRRAKPTASSDFVRSPSSSSSSSSSSADEP